MFSIRPPHFVLSTRIAMNRTSAEPSVFARPRALQLMHLLVVPSLLALTLLSASVLYVTWDPAWPMGADAATGNAAPAATAQTFRQQTPDADLAQSVDTTLASLQAP
jgi:hypothetical protein